MTYKEIFSLSDLDCEKIQSMTGEEYIKFLRETILPFSPEGKFQPRLAAILELEQKIKDWKSSPYYLYCSEHWNKYSSNNFEEIKNHFRKMNDA